MSILLTVHLTLDLGFQLMLNPCNIIKCMQYPASACLPSLCAQYNIGEINAYKNVLSFINLKLVSKNISIQFHLGLLKILD